MAGELISREALERIIQRAAELQAAERDIGEGLTKDELLTLGQDVGIPTRYLQQALLEEQTRTVVEEGHGTLPWLAGPLRLSAARVVPGERAALLKALGGWMEDEELLQVKRRYADRTSWEPKVGAFASIQRALGSKGKTYALARAAEVAGQVTQLEPGFCHAQLMANVQNLRKARLAGAGALAALATAAVALGAAVPIALISPLLFVTGAALGVTALFVARRHRLPWVRLSWRVVVAGLVTGVVLLPLAQRSLLVSVPLGALVYVAALWLLRAVQPEELDLLLRGLRLRRGA